MDTVEVSLFGPGKGESVVLRLKHDFWMVVDSCPEQPGVGSAPLAYLKDRGVDLETQVKLIVVSHWHDDHIQGMGELVEACPNAKVVLSNIVRQDKEFQTLVFALAEHTKMPTCGVSEMYKVISLLRKRSDSSGQIPLWAMQNRDLYVDQGNPPIRIRSLSPGDQANLSNRYQLGRYKYHLSPKRGLPSVCPNEASVVLHISVGDTYFLLGADQETGVGVGRGWNCILADSATPSDKACLLKVPHHGAKSGYHQGIWDTLMVPAPIAMVAPFVHGRQQLPTDSDQARLRKHTNQVYLTAPPKRPTPKRRDSTVQRSIREAGITIKATPFVPGQIRITFDPESHISPQIELLNGAYKLT